MLSLEGVQLVYGDTPILHAIDLCLAPGEVTVVLGPNGAGKSSLLRLASGELAPSAGRIEFLGRPLADLPLTDKARHMAVLPQHSLLNFPYTAAEVVMLGRTPHASGLAADRAIVEQALRAMDADYLSDSVYTHLSGGEKQRVQLARVMAQLWPEAGAGERLLILDEPTSALDYAHQQMVARQLQDLAREGCAVLAALHDLNLAASCADRLVLVCCGDIRAVGTPDEVLQVDLLKEVFQVEFHRLRHPRSGRPWLVT